MNGVIIKTKNGFTLAEVLITLVIVGVVAAMTIPTVVNNTKKQEYVSKLKKTYSTLAQATNKIIAEEGMPKGSVGGWASSSENIYNEYIKRLSNTKSCDNRADGCFTQKIYNLNNLGYRVWEDFGNSYYKFILSDGTQVMLWLDSLECTDNDNETTDVCATFMVDINGEKSPNVLGRDVFRFNLTENAFVPAGCNFPAHLDNDGWGRACRVIRENAMNY